MLIPCPWCGARPDSEFTAGGEARVTRPVDPAAASDAEWGDYVYFRKNVKGLQRERWFHAQGCRRWFSVERDTATHKISAAYPMGALPEGESKSDPVSARIAGEVGSAQGSGESTR